MSTHNRQYQVLGRHKPTEKEPQPKVYRMKILAPNTVVARSRFWYYLSKLRKVKRQNGEIISVNEIFEKNPNTVKNFGMWLRYDSRSGTHNMYKEYRDTTLNGAVDKMYSEMAGRHRARRSSIQIVRTAVVKAADCKRTTVTQFHKSGLKFRLLHRLPRPSNKQYKSTFKANAPSTFF
eukprot:TRINITY_DN66689_c6_g5_i1.p2 TRINITY_DN66689_c6_g5~~TRINITY_DN66689_c6_g5_i1.p2  ORF type:complete len:209 (+),score=99.54 TRINITY_DN66689_c6_g5_i1:96-629(+)